MGIAWFRGRIVRGRGTKCTTEIGSRVPRDRCPFSVRSESVYVCGAAVRRKSVYVRFPPGRSPSSVRVLAVGRAWEIGWGREKGR